MKNIKACNGLDRAAVILGTVRRKMVAIILLLFIHACQSNESPMVQTSVGEKENEQAAVTLLDSLSASFNYEIADVYGANELFDSISEVAFENLRSQRFQKALVPDSSGLFISADSTVVFTSLARLKYPGTMNNSDGLEESSAFSYSTYHGKIPETGLYVLSHWHSGSILTGRMSLIDSLSNTRYLIGSVSDGASDEVLVSPYARFVLYYSNSYHVSGAGLLDYRPGTPPVLRPLCSFKLHGLIEEAFWTTDMRLVLRLNHRERQKGWEDQYYFLASKALTYSWYDYRNQTGDSLDPVLLNQYLRYPWIIPYDSIKTHIPKVNAISFEDYQKAPSISLAPLDTSGMRIQDLQHNYLVRTADSLYLLPETSTTKRSRWYSTYKAYHPAMKLYEIYLVDGTHAIGQLMLIDSLTNQVLKPVSPFDAGIYDVRFSADGKYLMAISNSVYDPSSYLALWRISRDTRGILRLHYVVSHEMQDWNIIDYKWVAMEKVLLKTAHGLYSENSSSSFKYKELDLGLR